MVHQSMRNDSRMADEVYIKRCCLVLGDFLFLLSLLVLLYSKASTTWNHLRPFSCPDSLDTNFETTLPLLRYDSIVTNITYCKGTYGSVALGRSIDGIRLHTWA